MAAKDRVVLDSLLEGTGLLPRGSGVGRLSPGEPREH